MQSTECTLHSALIREHCHICDHHGDISIKLPATLDKWVAWVETSGASNRQHLSVPESEEAKHNVYLVPCSTVCILLPAMVEIQLAP